MVSQVTLRCEQAIFTSIRTPMGEGYRIIAASRGLKPEDKQVITRLSPSHAGLCNAGSKSEDDMTDSIAASFFELPSRRVCVALSCAAGAEHTGRGGQRVYTHHVILETGDLARCGFNPLRVWRAMHASGLAVPQLKPPPLLPDLSLSVDVSDTTGPEPTIAPMIGRDDRRRILSSLLDREHLILNIPDGWIATAEALLLGLPGPFRTKVSFGAGLTYSVGRCHHLQIIYDADGASVAKAVGQNVEVIQLDDQPVRSSESEPEINAWTTFVDRHWSQGRFRELDRRTSLPFADSGPTARERIGKAYNQIDGAADLDSAKLLSIAAEHLTGQRAEGIEGTIDEELVTRCGKVLRERFARQSWKVTKPFWAALLDLRRHSQPGDAFAKPIMIAALRAASTEDPLSACERALDLVQPNRPDGIPELTERLLVDELLSSLTRWVQIAPEPDLTRIGQVASKWWVHRPDCPHLMRVREQATSALKPTR